MRKRTRHRGGLCNICQELSVTTLESLKPGTKARVMKVSGNGALHRRIMDMGVIPGATVEMKRVAPLGDPIAVKIKDYLLSLRKDEASHIFVQVI